MSESRITPSLFQDEELEININGVTVVHSVDISEVYPGYFDKGEYIIHSSGGYHFFKDVHLKRNNIPKWFSKPVFPWIQSVHRKDHIPTPRVPLNRGFYPYTSFKKAGNKKFKLHRMVADAFIENPENKRIVHHKNNMKFDYRVCNLEWRTDEDNSEGAGKEKLVPPIETWDAVMTEFTQSRKQYDMGEE
jgi:hypothetical protein